ATKANVYPYFIGVFDTVAALGRPAAVVLLAVAFAIVVAGIGALASFLAMPLATYLFPGIAFVEIVSYVLGGLAGAIALIGLVAFLRNYVKCDFRVPGYGWLQSLKTIHLAPPKHKFTDYSLNPNVAYAKHAISIDENRKDFARVPWNPDAKRMGTRDAFGNIQFEQVWFCGVHADVGGGYPENESRLSDITLGGMLAGAPTLPNGIKSAAAVLTLYPDAAGPQHDECKAGRWQHGVRILPAGPDGESRATMHKSVYARFAVPDVVQYDLMAAYRPDNIRKHVDFAHYYVPGAPAPTGALKGIAEDVEAKWEKQKAAPHQ